MVASAVAVAVAARLPKATCLPSSIGAGLSVTNHCEVAVCGPLLAIESSPGRLCCT
jgi:hypothetical protein